MEKVFSTIEQAEKYAKKKGLIYRGGIRTYGWKWKANLKRVGDL